MLPWSEGGMTAIELSVFLRHVNAFVRGRAKTQWLSPGNQIIVGKKEV